MMTVVGLSSLWALGLSTQGLSICLGGSMVALLLHMSLSGNSFILADLEGIQDTFMIMMSVMAGVVTFGAFLAGASPKGLSGSLLPMMLLGVVVFHTSNLFVLYLAYEASLLPISYVILRGGVYSDRALGVILMAAYTIIFSLPFLLVLFAISLSGGGLGMDIPCGHSLGGVLSGVSFLAFAVKLPIYGVHFWLPLAHVEAPTFGSMVLAGLLLKLGGAGLYRMSGVLSLKSLGEGLVGYCLVFFVLTGSICVMQADIKRLVAYSSVFHMMIVPMLVLAPSELGVEAMQMALFFHGVSSPMLFCLVGGLYATQGTRQILLTRGLMLTSPLLGVMLLGGFILALPAPPFPSFISEVCILASVYSLSSSFTPPVIFLAVVVPLLYNGSWVITALLGPSGGGGGGSAPLPGSVLPLHFSLLVCLASAPLISFFGG